MVFSIQTSVTRDEFYSPELKARIILAVIPKDTEITLIPRCKETMRLGMWEPPEEYHPFLYMLMISKISPKKAMKQHKKHYLQVMSQVNS